MANFINLDLLTRYDSNIKNYFNHADERLMIAFNIASANTQIELFPSGLVGLTYIDWGDGTTVDKNNTTHTYTTIGVYRAYFHGVTALAANALSGFSQIISIYIPNTVTSIGDYALSYNYNLKEVNIPDSVTSLGESVFEESSSISNLTIGNGVTNIGAYAFHHCSLNTLTFTRATPPTVTSTVGFDYVTKIYVPLSSLSTYKTATNWSTYASKIVAIVDTNYMDSNLPTLQDWTV